MCHIIDEVILHLCYLTLTCYHEESEREGDHKNGDEDKRRQHKVDRLVYIVIKCREEHTDDAHTVGIIITEHGLIITVCQQISRIEILTIT